MSCVVEEEEKLRLLELRRAEMTIQDCSDVLGRPYSGVQAQLERLSQQGRTDESELRRMT